MENVKSVQAEPVHLATPDIGLRSIFRLASPIFVANLAIMGSALIDTFMAGRLGAEDLASVAVANAAIALIFIAFSSILQSLSPIAGHHFGARLYSRIGYEMIQSSWLAVFLSVIAVTCILQTDFWIAFGNVSGRVADMTRTILIAGAVGAPAAIGSRVFISMNAAVSRPNITMWVSLTLLCSKIPLNMIFMYGAFGIPAFHGAGAGLSSTINVWLGLLAYFVYYKCSPFYSRFRAKRLSLPHLPTLREHLKIGLPIGLSTFFEVSAFSLMAIFIARIGTIDVAAHQIVSNITACLFMVCLSLGIAASVLVSQCLGAGFPGEARRVTHRILTVSIVIACVLSALAFVFRRDVVSLFSTDSEVIEMASMLLIFGTVYHVFDALQSVSGFALRGYRVTFMPMVIYGLFLFGVGLGGGCWLGFDATILGGPFGAAGFWAATGLGLILCGVALLIMVLRISTLRARPAGQNIP